MDNSEIINTISKHFGLEELISKILVSRGIDSLDKIEKFLYPNVKDLTPLSKYYNLDKVTNRVNKAINNQETIVLYGDYDCDGICGVSILYLYLSSKGANVHYFLPNRHNDGYGLSNQTLEKIAESLYPDLIITVDCGITNCKEVEYAQQVLGIDIIVTDHHEPLEILPDCLIFNTKLCEEGGFRSLCGAGVALRLVESLSNLQESKKYYDIAALATVADIVPLTDDNRIIVYNGLKLINLGRRKGLKMLVDKCVKHNVKSSDIGFKIAPRINSVGRIGDANKVVDLFIDDDTFILTSLIDEIEKSNEIRQTLTNDLVADCMEKLIGYDFSQTSILVMYDKYWNDGVLGIASAKLASEFNRPVILLTKSGDFYKGSGRSVEGINIFNCVKSVSNLLYKFGGHSMACGLSISEDKIDDFIQQINFNCKKMYGDIKLVPVDHSFCELNYLNLDLAKQLEFLEPYGEANREVEFYTYLKEADFYQLGNSDHLKYSKDGIDYIAYFSLDKINLLNSNTEKKINFNVSVNSFRNKDTPQIVIQNILANKVENDINLANYIEQGLCEDDCLGKIYEVDIHQAEHLIDDKDYGVIYLCYNYDVFKLLNKEFLSKIFINNTFMDSLCPYNRLVFNPSKNLNFKYYDKVVFLESILSKGFVDNLNINKDTKIYCVSNDSMIKKCASKLLSYKELGKVFIAVRNILSDKVYTDFTAIYNQLNINAIDYNSFCIAMYIFLDLGIVKINNNGIIIDRNVRTSLDSSKLYSKLKEVYGEQ